MGLRKTLIDFTNDAVSFEGGLTAGNASPRVSLSAIARMLHPFITVFELLKAGRLVAHRARRQRLQCCAETQSIMESIHCRGREPFPGCAVYSVLPIPIVSSAWGNDDVCTVGRSRFFCALELSRQVNQQNGVARSIAFDMDARTVTKPSASHQEKAVLLGHDQKAPHRSRSHSLPHYCRRESALKKRVAAATTLGACPS